MPPRSPGGSGNKGIIAALGVLALAVGGVAAALLVIKGHSATSTVHASNPTTTTSAAQTTTVVTVVDTQTGTAPNAGSSGQTTTTTGSSGSGNPGPGQSPSLRGKSAAASAPTSAAGTLDTYWNDVNSGRYGDAVSLSTSSEAQTASVSTFQSEQPHIHVMWTTTVSNASVDQVVRISFYARNTVGNDQVCRHFVISSLMKSNGSGGWLYDGHAPGTNTIGQDAPGNPNCPA